MKTLLVVTHVDFWRRGAGHRSRLSALLHFLADKFVITVVYAGLYSENDNDTVAVEFPAISVIALEPDRIISFKEHGELFEAFIAGRSFDAVLIEYIEMSFVLPLIDSSTLTILDTHDLVTDRIRSFQENALPYNGISMSDEEEISIFNCFDKVLLIQEADHEKIGKQIGFDRAILVPHAPVLRKRKLRKDIKSIGFLGSEYAPNVDAIMWFLDNVWPSLDNDMVLNIYGDVAWGLSKELNDHRVHIHGFVKDISGVYDSCDIMINPVRCGAGLKIKNIEAMSNGVPLITTTHGATGLAEAVDKCFLIADSPQQFIDAIAQCKSSGERLASEAYAFIEEKFSPHACYGELADLINQYQLTE